MSKTWEKFQNLYVTDEIRFGDNGTLYANGTSISVGELAALNNLSTTELSYLDSVTPGTVEANKAVVTDASFATAVGAVASPASGTTAVSISKVGPIVRLVFTLTAARMTCTDGAGSGSHGSLKIFDFVANAVSFLGCRQNYTAFAEGAALTGAAGDAAFEIGVGTTAISAAAEKTLGDGAQENVGQAIAITLSGGTGTGTAVNGAVVTAIDGTTTAVDLHLNWSGSAATIDATSTLDVTGTIEVVCALLGDD